MPGPAAKRPVVYMPPSKKHPKRIAALRIKAAFTMLDIPAPEPPVAANPKPKPDNPEQSKRFIDTAGQLETDDSPEAFETVFKRVGRPKAPTRSS
jgi:hypothetical protein